MIILQEIGRARERIGIFVTFGGKVIPSNVRISYPEAVCQLVKRRKLVGL